MVFQDSTNLNNVSKYIVDANGGDTPYTTIQSALDAANTAGNDAIVIIRPGTYTEDLTLYSGITLKGSSSATTTIAGKHSCGALTKAISFYNLKLQSSTDIFNTFTTAAGIELIFDSCEFNCTDGYIVNLFTWTGDVIIRNCSDSSTINGVLLNTSGAANLSIFDSVIGAGASKSLTPRNNPVIIENSTINCPVSISVGTSSIEAANSTFSRTLTTSGGTLASALINCSFNTAANAAISHSSGSLLTLSETSINSTANPCITGTGAIKFGSVTFLTNSEIAGTITQTLTPVEKTGEIHAENIQNLAFSGFLSWAGAGAYYSVAGNVVTVERSGAGYIKSKLMSWTGPQSTGALSAGSTYYIYMDSTGTIGTTSTRTTALFEDNVVLFEAMIDSSGVPNVIVVRENHPYTFPVESSEWAHDTIGPVISNKNKGANITLNGTKGIQINGADELEDHGLTTVIPDSAAAAVTFSFMYTNGAGKWIRNATANTFPSEYNNAGVVAVLGANKYGVFRLYVSKDDINSSTPTYYAIYDDQQYNNLTAANTAIALGTPATASAELAQLELAQLGFVVKEESSDTIVNVVIEKETARTSFTGASSNQASLILTDTTNFDGWLSATDTTVQTALETLDDVGKGITIDPAAATDSFVQFDESTVNKWRIGNDASDDSFRISQGNALGVNDIARMFSGGETNWPTQPAFLAILGSGPDNNVTGDGTIYFLGTNVALTEIFDQNSDFTPGTGTFTAPVAGRYLLSCIVAINDIDAAMTFGSISISTSNRIHVDANFNYAAIRTVAGTANRASFNVSHLCDMDAADTAQVRVQIIGSGKTADIAANSPNVDTGFSGFLAC